MSRVRFTPYRAASQCSMLSGVATASPERSTPPPGVTAEVLVAAVAFSLGAGSGAAAGTLTNAPNVLLLLGWPIFALTGAAILDARPGSSVGRTLVVFSIFPAVDLVWAGLDAGGLPTSASLTQAESGLAALQAAAVALAVPWAFKSPRARGPALVCVLLTVTGALAVLAGQAWLDDPAVRTLGWSLTLLGSASFYGVMAHETTTVDRMTRRRIAWLLVTLTLSASVAAATWLLPADLTAFVICFDLWLTALVVARLYFIDEFRPLQDHATDLAVVLSVVVSAAVVGALVRIGVGWTRLQSPTTFAAFSALFTAAVAVPVALRIRRTVMARHYGSGTISPSDVAVITADLHAQANPRDLLGKAAQMVASASGSRKARIVLGVDAPGAPDEWRVHALVVGGEQVGALLVESVHPEGPEPRQERIVSQLLPTVALVARAVGLAVEAEHARQDVARERDAERKRILGDLHDGLGPVLAGMSMRVQAALRNAPDSEYADLLRDLADDLAGSRTDLRRLVAGITPSVLDDGDLESALGRLVRSFQGVADGPGVSLEVELDGVLPPGVQVAVYRSVAEGITNALRHSGAATIDVGVRTSNETVLVDVVDDGSGGPVVPGVGLSSLRQRAVALGGCLQMASAEPRGTHLHLELPAREGARK
jgi:signal transduction histidine kinase